MMLYTGLKPLAARCKAQTKPGSHDGPLVVANIIV